jgi:hypothetical protein
VSDPVVVTEKQLRCHAAQEFREALQERSGNNPATGELVSSFNCRMAWELRYRMKNAELSQKFRVSSAIFRRL